MSKIKGIINYTTLTIVFISIVVFSNIGLYLVVSAIFNYFIGV